MDEKCFGNFSPELRNNHVTPDTGSDDAFFCSIFSPLQFNHAYNYRTLMQQECSLPELGRACY